MKRRTSFLSMGIPSMCMIFSVLCLVILALLTLGTSRQDLQSSRLALEQTTAYYTACSTATQQYDRLTEFITSAATDSNGKKEYLSRMTSVQKNFPDITDLIWNKNTQTLSYSVDFTDTQAIYIEINAAYFSNGNQTAVTPAISIWKTISTADWNPDTRQPVYKGDIAP